jgi:hypothetical protein
MPTKMQKGRGRLFKNSIMVLGDEQNSQKLRFSDFYLLRRPNFNLTLTLNMLFDTKFNSGHFNDKNVKIRWKLELFDWKKRILCEFCSTPDINSTCKEWVVMPKSIQYNSIEMLIGDELNKKLFTFGISLVSWYTQHHLWSAPGITVAAKYWKCSQIRFLYFHQS